MSKQRAQGTRLETRIVNLADDHGLPAARLAEGGVADEGDVWLVNPPHLGPIDIVAVWWKRLVKGSGSRRVPDGEPEVVILTATDFLRLLKAATDEAGGDLSAIVEAKARERLNVTRTLHRARQKALRGNGG